MKLGVGFPQRDVGTGAEEARAYVQAVRELGYDYLRVTDMILGADPDRHPDFGHELGTNRVVQREALTLLAFAAGAAPGLGLATWVLNLPQRQTALVAKQAAEIDLLSGGRLRLGVGIGRMPQPYRWLGVEFKGRGRRLEEQVALLRRLWTEPSVTFEGREHRIEAAGINPLPVQRPIPVWIGGSSEAALRRAARTADGLFASPGYPPADGWPAQLERVRGWLREAGRDPAAFGLEGTIQIGRGTPDDWHRQAEEWRALGATHLGVSTGGSGLSRVEAHVARLREAREAIR